ncbi:uncharacterized protein LOC110620206 isoform X2 [Manihot esculenta]|uniref:uncharacterized protein LOC110620206 isoform X2 n=1 Tax=Manihot esculenta TaxID=3983 RepID=UPI001CC4C201|nr:uncharacterized protein LOC110620206 isoform X2 [Manihot esculenta]
MLICGVKLGNHILSKRHCFIILQRDFHLQHKKKTCECEAVRASMAATSESSASDLKLDLIQTIRSHEVALAELNNLPSSRPCLVGSQYLNGDQETWSYLFLKSF